MNTKNIEDIYNLSPMQEGMLFHTLYTPDANIYLKQLNMQLKVQGLFDLAAFNRAAQRLGERHPVLRSAFSWEDRANPLQVVLKQAQLPVSYFDWRELPEDEQTLQLAALLEADRKISFDLAKAPLLRITLIALKEEILQCLFSYHHLLFDGWSLPILLHELFAFYDAECDGTVLHLPRPRAYRDYIGWLQKQDKRQAELFWRENLRGFPSANRLPGSFIQSQHPDSPAGYATTQRTLSSAGTLAIHSFARERQLTLSTLIQGAWALLLHKYTGDQEVVFGITVSGRPAELEGMESMVGLFINTLPLRISLTEEPRLLPWLRSLQIKQAEILQYEYSSLAQIQTWSEIPRGQVLFESLVTLENLPGEQILEQSQSRLRIHGARPEVRTNYPLTLMVGSGERLVLLLGYETPRFSQSVVEQFLLHLERLLIDMTMYPHRKLADFNLLTNQEKLQQLTVWNNTAQDYPLDQCLHQLFEAQVGRTPDALAVVFAHASLTYQCLNEQANQLARILQTHGAGPDVRVGLLIEHSLEAMIAILGILKAGGAYVPLDPSFPSERLLFLLADAAVPLLVTQEKLLHLVPERAIPIITCEAIRDLMREVSTENVEAAVTPANLAYIIYTSGSTGSPKGAMIPHASLVNYALWASETLIGTEVACQPATSRFSFDACIKQLFPPLLRGDSIWMVPDNLIANPPELARELSVRSQIGLSCVPSLWKLILDAIEMQSIQFPTQALAALYFGGEKLSPELVHRTYLLCPGVTIWNVYGPTETTANSVVARIADEEPIHIGRPIANTRVYVLDRHLQLIPPGLPGELYIGGAGLSRGYLNASDVTAEKFLPDPFSLLPGSRLYKTGDFVQYRPDGTLEYISRRDSQLKLRGFRVEPGEIEAVLRHHADIDEAVVIANGPSSDQIQLVAYVVPTPGATITAIQLRRYLEGRLPQYMIPAQFLSLEKLPLSHNGKVDRQALLAMRSLQPQPEEIYREPQSTLEQQIAQIWREVLQVDKVGLTDNFFDLGGHSLHMIRVYGKIKKLATKELSMVDLFQYTTVRDIALFLAQEDPVPPQQPEQKEMQEIGTTIAIVGMAGRFPGANTIDEFWQNLCEGTESISFFTEEELMEEVPAEVFRNPHYVPARGALTDVEGFDAAFFGYTPREAETMDPQHRIFLEIAYHALEHAGYDSRQYPGRIGVYGGAGTSNYLLFNLMSNLEFVASIGGFQLMVGNGNDALTTRISYKLDLTGPAVSIQTACSTSLVATHMACQALLRRECDMALAGGISVSSVRKAGYQYEEGGITSPDGHCRPFSAEAQGTVTGHGGGVVVLKRLEEALADHDTIYALICSSAINNDGSQKVSYAAPSVSGQASVITEALTLANLPAHSISYVETHGTGTPLGDPIEVAALSQAFRSQTKQHAFCALGSVKANIGHLDAAAGIAGLIKTALALHHRYLPASLHADPPNPLLKLAESPFFLNTISRPWNPAALPRRAGVSSFGVGGTNAHLILQEAPTPSPLAPPASPLALLPLSAATPQALERQMRQMATFLQQAPAASLADIAFTLQVGRRALPVRSFLVATSPQQASAQWSQPILPAGRLLSSEEATPSLIFLFPGGGAQHAGMGGLLASQDPIIAEHLERCLQLFAQALELDLRPLLFNQLPAEQASLLLRQSRWGLPALFSLEYALAQRWLAWGIEPAALLGHSLGEYTAACLAGVFSLPDAVALVAERARLFAQLPAGTMLSVPLSEATLLELLPPELSIAAVNGAHSCVVAGPHQPLQTFADQLQQQGITVQPLHIEVAAHSQQVEAIVGPFVRFVRGLTLHPPQRRVLSNVTGTWLTSQQACDPAYWGQHLRQTVRFGQALTTAQQLPHPVFLEVGPGRSLSGLVRQQELGAGAAPLRSITSLPHPAQRGQNLWGEQEEAASLLLALGQLWQEGVEISWSRVHAGQPRQRLPLPLYPFEHQRYWIAPRQQSQVPQLAIHKQKEISHWFYLPGWRRSILTPTEPIPSATGPWLLLLDEAGSGSELIQALRQAGETVCVVQLSSQPAPLTMDGDTFTLSSPSQFASLMPILQQRELLPRRLVHLAHLQTPSLPSNRERFAAQQQGILSLLALIQALINTADAFAQLSHLLIVTRAAYPVLEAEAGIPELAPLLALAMVLQQEHLHLTCRCLDLPPLSSSRALPWTQILLQESGAASSELLIAYRGRDRWRRTYEPCFPEPHPRTHSRLRSGGVYLITGALGRVGMLLADHLARHYQARLVLLSHQPFPSREQWPLLATDPTSTLALTIQRVQALEAAGSELLLLHADVADRSAMQQVLQQTLEQFGTLHGVLHTAGVTRGPSVSIPFESLSPAELETQFGPKVLGTYVLEEILADLSLDFCLLFSSNASILGGLGFGAYAAANAFLDAFVAHRRQQSPFPWIVANWDGWPLKEEEIEQVKIQTSMERLAMDAQEAVEAFERVLLLQEAGQIVVSTSALEQRWLQWIARKIPQHEDSDGTQHYPRPWLSSSYEAAESGIQELLVAIWQDILGITPIGIHDNFFEMGGHSLLATQLISRSKSAFQIDIPLASLFEGPTIVDQEKIIVQTLATLIDGEMLEQL
ncbi:non-ribosomal peptide synthetase/type I polyketide synthase [Tengunoibacter tsumagoiensis]|uniref:Phenolphthiocerol/phthiocerol polyketide synthase subunit E n=1 Tax=Tengunoibacter tsumagoiensis TaxID=2014871 RepID=A0A402A967_9CHLR|nr:non-ribosomal peptide synthetase/type I polyketide synthase [Tengunoibacter tsumagoiensis]GCE15702.1 hypothetical protein KTT_55610 [Tengunoibacter tsumagoiensis]